MKTPTHIKIAVVTLLLLIAAVQADWPTHPKDKDPALNLYLGIDPPIAPNKWKYGETIVTLNDSSKTLTVSGKGAMVNYDGDMGSIRPPWYDSRDAIEYVVIEEGVTYIGDGAFSDCMNMLSVTIPNSVTTIGHTAFMSCKSLTSVTIPNGVTAIECYAFANCTSLTSITIPSSVTHIGQGVFDKCANLAWITIRNPIPAETNYNVCDSTIRANVYLYVPFGSVAAYRAAEGWKYFDYIIPIISYKEIALGILTSLILAAAIFVIIKKLRRRPRQLPRED